MFNQVTFLDRSKTNLAKIKPSLGLITIIHILKKMNNNYYSY